MYEEDKSLLWTQNVVKLLTNVPGVSFAQVSSSRMEDRLVLHHLHNTFSV